MKDYFSVSEIIEVTFNFQDDKPTKVLLPNKNGDKDWALKVMRGYGKHEGLFNKLAGILYKICNAIKAIFGQSDFQKARNSITKKFQAINLTNYGVDEKDLLKAKQAKKILCQKEAEIYLTDLIALTKVKVERVSELKKEVDEMLENRAFNNPNKKLFMKFIAFIPENSRAEYLDKAREVADSLRLF
ncbi:MAG: hypothetical protein VX777_06010 [Chlamydiota bacterium]|nr:hypothetical protein [Chlamydiota bacterium]